MNIVICEDNKEDANNLNFHIQKYFQVINCPVNTALYESGDCFLKDFEVAGINDLKIMFLDIYMPGPDGISVARRIRQRSDDIVIIFTTTSLNHGLDGFAVDALQYLVKPVSYPQVENVLGKCMAKFADSLRFIEVLSDRLKVKVLLKDITYIEVFNTAVVIHTISEKIKSYLPLTELEKQLEGSTFLRTHRSFIVNMHYIYDISDIAFILADGTAVPIRKNDRLAVRQAHRDYLFRQSREE